MHITSVQVGRAKEVLWEGKMVSTSIYKTPVDNVVQVKKNNLEGDEQADLKVHGGLNKAIYAYPAEHYPWWQFELYLEEVPWGIFGENLTIVGWKESEVNIGDIFKAGNALLMAVQPRFPCFKLGIRFNNKEVVRKFWEAQKPGIYFKVVREGELKKGDDFVRVQESTSQESILDAYLAYTQKPPNPVLLEKLMANPYLPDPWKKGLSKLLNRG